LLFGQRIVHGAGEVLFKPARHIVVRLADGIPPMRLTLPSTKKAPERPILNKGNASWSNRLTSTAVTSGRLLSRLPGAAGDG
jgi:hypothetical protein